MTLALIVLLVAAAIATEAFFSGSEIAFISANRPRLLRLAKEDDVAGTVAKNLLSRPELLFSTTVVGTTLAMSVTTTVTELWMTRHFGEASEWMNILLISPFILLFGEFIPKMLGRSRADSLVLRVAEPLRLASVALSPITRALQLYARAMRRLAGDPPERGIFLSREEILAALPASRGTDVTPAERQLIRRILDFGDVTARELLRPLIDVVAIEENEPVERAVAILAESGHSRLPVYRERIDHIVGVLKGFDCLGVEDLSAPVKTMMSPPFFIPESKPVDELLLELRTRPVAVAVNEFGGAEGIVTMEDVIEEIVGEIEDEYDEPPRLYHRIGEASYIVSARMEIDALREELKLPIPEDEDYQTLAGYLLQKMQRIPKKWDSIVIDGVEYIIQSATERTIEEVYVIVHPRK